MKNIVCFSMAIISVATLSCEKQTAQPAVAILSDGQQTARPVDQVVVIKTKGKIQDDLDAFRNMLGPLNTTPGHQTGRREINWDDIPDNMNEKPMPLDFFNPTGKDAVASMQRGITYSSIGSFMVSNNGFKEINSAAASQFNAFSGAKTFANISAAKWDVSFQRAGTTIAAAVQGFGLVFSDVDEDNSTSLEFFNGNKSVGKYFVPAHDATGSFSFLGVYFKNAALITKVTVRHDGFLTEGTRDVSQKGSRDLIVLDDFIYSEPVRQ